MDAAHAAISRVIQPRSLLAPRHPLTRLFVLGAHLVDQLGVQPDSLWHLDGRRRASGGTATGRTRVTTRRRARWQSRWTASSPSRLLRQRPGVEDAAAAEQHVLPS